MIQVPACIVRAKALADTMLRGPGCGFFARKSAPEVADLFIYDAIGEGMFGGGIGPKTVQAALDAAKGARELRVYINSPGGDVFDGVTIMNQVARFEGKRSVYVDGIAASAASMIAMAGDEISIASNGTIMIHEAWGAAMGNASDLRGAADLLDKITHDAVLAAYDRTRQPRTQVLEWMKAETWMNAEEAVQRGFADKIVGGDAQASALVRPMVAALAHAIPDAAQRSAPARRESAARVAALGAQLSALRSRRASPAPVAPGQPVTVHTPNPKTEN